MIPGRSIVVAAGVVAAGAALVLHPHLLTTFATQLRPVRVTLSAPGAREIRAQWDEPGARSGSFTDFGVVRGDHHRRFTATVEILAERNERSRGRRVCVQLIRTPEQAIPWSAVTLSGPWEPVVDSWRRGMDGRFQCSTKPGSRLEATLEGSELQLRLQTGPFAGRARLAVDGQLRVVDLYSASWDQTDTSFYAEAPPGYGPKTYDVVMRRGEGRWQKIRFSAVPDVPVEVVEASAEGLPLRRLDARTVEIPRSPWAAHRVAWAWALLAALLLFASFLAGARVWRDAASPPAPGARGREMLAAAAFATTVAVVLTGLFYPGVYNDDGLARWQRIVQIQEEGFPLQHVSNRQPPLMPALMLAAHSLSGEFGLSTLLQLLAFYYSLGLLSLEVLGRRAALVLVPLLALVPGLLANAVLLSLDTVTVTALMATLVLLYRRRQRDVERRDVLFGWPLLVVCTMVLVAMRHNTIAFLLPLLGAVALIIRSRRQRFGCLAACVIGALLAQAVPSTMGIKMLKGVSSIGIAGEVVGMLKHIGDDTVTERFNLDFAGDTRRAVEVHQTRSVGPVAHLPGAPLPAERLLEDAPRVRSTFFALVRAYPGAFLLNRFRSWSYLLGIADHMHDVDCNDRRFLDRARIVNGRLDGPYYDRIPGSVPLRLKEWNLTLLRLPLVGWTYDPWFLFASFALLGAAAWKRGGIRPAVWLAGGAAAAYYGTFFIPSASATFRYFFPSYVLLLIGIAGCLVHLAPAAVRARLEPRPSPPEPTTYR